MLIDICPPVERRLLIIFVLYTDLRNVHSAFKMQFYWFLHHVDVAIDVSCRSEIELFQILFSAFFLLQNSKSVACSRLLKEKR